MVTPLQKYLSLGDQLFFLLSALSWELIFKVELLDNYLIGYEGALCADPLSYVIIGLTDKYKK